MIHTLPTTLLLVQCCLIFFFFCIPVDKKISLLIAAASERFTDDVTVSEWGRTSAEAHRWTEASLEYTRCATLRALLYHISHDIPSWT